MPRFKNVSKLGDLLIAGVGFVEAGETFDVSPDQVEAFEGQTENYEAVPDGTPPAPTPAKPVDAPPADASAPKENS